MSTDKTLRIVLASVCALTLLFVLVLPIASYYGMGIGFFEMLKMMGQSAEVTIFLILLFGGIGALICAGIMSVLFNNPNRNVAINGIIAGSVVAAAYLFFMIVAAAEGGGSVLGAGCFINLLLAIAIIVISAILLSKYSAPAAGRAGYQAANADYNARPQSGYNPRPYGGGFNPRTRSSGNARIIGLSGVYQNASFDVSDGRPVMFGRDTNTCSVLFDQFETAVSRQHCIVTFLPNADMYSVRDVSKNGTYLGSMNNRMPTNVEQNVKRGTILYLGSNKNSFKLD